MCLQRGHRKTPRDSHAGATTRPKTTGKNRSTQTRERKNPAIGKYPTKHNGIPQRRTTCQRQGGGGNIERIDLFATITTATAAKDNQCLLLVLAIPRELASIDLGAETGCALGSRRACPREAVRLSCALDKAARLARFAHTSTPVFAHGVR